MKTLKEQVFRANLELVEKNLVVLTWGNVSAIDRDKNLVAIKPSGVSYDAMTVDDIVIVDLEGNIVEGSLNPSSDTATHLQLYKDFENITSVVHTHSQWATTLAQAGMSVPCAGTTHADTFYGTVPATRAMNEEETQTDYELNTAKVIVETFVNNDLNPDEIPAVLVNDHGPFVWGTSASNAVENAIILEEVSKMYYHQVLIDSLHHGVDQHLLDKHYLRKHGTNAYYGQKKEDK